MRQFPVLLLTALLAVGCDCGGTIGAPCSTDSDCDPGEVCTDGSCRSMRDTGPRDGSPPDCTDVDRDGICEADDCDDLNPDQGGPEICDRLDNDCDGTADEGISTLCADCSPGCSSEEIPGPGGWMPTEDNSDGVIVDADGALTLGRNEARAFAVWIANSGEGTVSRLDSRTGAETGRYPTVGSMAPAGTRPWNEGCTGSAGNCPSRTAVDQNFDAYVANRAFGNQGSLTKYANREADCVDRNSNGMIDTSRDIDGDGIIAMGTAEFVGLDDECILYTVPVGPSNGVPRALAIGIAPPDAFVGDVWVGLFTAREACRYNPADGSLIGCIDTAGFSSFQPYGMAADSRGRIWTVDRSNARPARDVLGYIDSAAMSFTTVSGMPAASSCAIPYGVTVDGAGDVFMANQCDPSIWRYRPSTGEWTPVDAVAFSGSTRGVAADEANLWVALSHNSDGFSGGDSNRVRQYRLSDLSFVAEHTMPTGLRPIGVGVSFDGSLWAICQGNNIAARLEPSTGVWSEHQVGVGPYTYSDFIGFGLNVFAEPRGRYRFVVEGCESGLNTWTGSDYTAEVPPGTSVEVWVRAADTIAALDAETFIGPFVDNPSDFTMAPGPVPQLRYLEVELRLATMDRMTAPRIFSIDIGVICEPIIM